MKAKNKFQKIELVKDVIGLKSQNRNANEETKVKKHIF